MPATTTTPRHGIKKASSEAQRRAMNQRRHEMTQQIRKTKRSHIVARKRRFTSTSITTTTSTSTTTADTALTRLAVQYIQTKDASLLEALQSALSQQGDDSTSLATLLDRPQENDVLPSEDTPATRLVNTLAYSLADPNSTHATQLLAARVLTNLAAISSPKSDNYYAWQPEGWCVVICASQALPCMMHILRDSSSNELIQQCCWAIGNMSGDSDKARQLALTKGVAMPLVHVLRVHHDAVEICRNAAWALTNLLRGGPNSSIPLDPHLISQLLVSPEQKQSNSQEVSWWDVAFEACWIVAFGTAHDDKAVHDFVVSSPICKALACRLETCTRQVQNSQDALRMTVPCLRAIGNIATACQGQFVPLLLQHGGIVPSLAKLIQTGFVRDVAVEAAWTAGSLLCDAGLPGHPSSTVAAPTLLPVLLQVVVSPHTKLNLKREAVSALWNAVAAPPIQDMAQVLSSRQVRNEFLQEMSTLPDLVPSLVRLLSSVDVDAVLYAVQVLNAMLRQNERVRVDFRQADGVDMLEQVCDRASQVSMGTAKWDESGTMSQCADICADLIDDLFSNQEEEEQLEVNMTFPNNTNGGTFTFGLLTDTPQMFDFDHDGAASPVNHSNNGQGRGRGKPVPAWMSQGDSRVARNTGTFPW